MEYFLNVDRSPLYFPFKKYNFIVECMASCVISSLCTSEKLQLILRKTQIMNWITKLGRSLHFYRVSRWENSVIEMRHAGQTMGIIFTSESE